MAESLLNDRACKRWDGALRRFQDHTGVNFHIDSPETLRDVASRGGVVSMIEGRKTDKASYAKHTDHLLRALEPVLEETEWLLSMANDKINSRERTRGQMMFLAFESLILAADDDISYTAIAALFKKIPRIGATSCEDMNSAPAVPGPFINVLASLIILVGVAYTITREGPGWMQRHGVSLSGSDYIVENDSIKSLLSNLQWEVNAIPWARNDWLARLPTVWERVLTWSTIRDVSDVSEQSSSTGPGVKRTNEFIATLARYWDTVKAPRKETIRLKSILRSLSERISSLKLDEHSSIDMVSVILGALFTLVKVAKDDHASNELVREICGHIKERLDHSQLVIDTADPTLGQYPIRVGIQLLAITARATNIIHNHRVRLRATSLAQSSSSLIARDNVLQEKLAELSWILDEAVAIATPQATGANARFGDIWKEAMDSYMDTTGIDVSSLEAVQGVDSLTMLSNALEDGRYTFQREHKKSSEIRTVVRPVAQFLDKVIDPVADAASSHIPHAKVVAGALKILLDAADKIGEAYEPTLELLSKLSGVTDRLRVYLTKRMPKEMEPIFVKALSHLLEIFGLVTRIMKNGYIDRLRGMSDDREVQTALRKLDRLAEDEASMAIALVLTNQESGKADKEDGQASGASLTPAREPETIRRVLPPRPRVCVGRDEHKDVLKQSILAHEPVVVLGTGGIGKTTLAVEVLHDYDVVVAYPSRHFAPCDAVTTPVLFLFMLADVLDIPKEERGQNILKSVLRSLDSDPAVLLVDNFETLWDIAGNRTIVEEYLAHFADLHNLALVVTMRGAEPPMGPTWRECRLRPISHDDGIAAFKLVAGIPSTEDDECVSKLVEAVEGLPLAITLLAKQVQPDVLTTAALWSRWKKQSVSAISVADGAVDKSRDLAVSIELSLNSPRLRTTPSARTALALVAKLPEGLPSEGSLLDELDDVLTPFMKLSDSLLALTRTSLIYISDSGGGKYRRYRMLSPIRDYCNSSAALPLSAKPLEILSTAYFAAINRRKDGTRYDYISVATVPPELPNVFHILATAIRHAKQSPEPTPTRRTIEVLTVNEIVVHDYYLGASSVDLLQLCIGHVDDGELLGDCYHTMGNVYLHLNKYDDAETALYQALEHHKASGSQQGEANDLKDLAWIYQYRNDLNHARDTLEEALSLHRAIEDRLGEADAFQSLGDLFFRQDDLDNAEASLNNALSLYGAIDNRLGEANTLKSLGDVYCQRNDYDKAEHTYKKAALLHRSLQDRLGEATDHSKLASMYIVRGDPDEAEESSRTALDLYCTIHDWLGKANSLQDLGRVYLYWGNLPNAEESVKNALALHQAVQDRVGEATDLTVLGEVYVKSDRDAEAEKVLCDAVKLSRGIHDLLNEGRALLILGQVHTKMECFDEAEAALTRALELHRGIEGADVNVQINEGLLEELRKAREQSAQEASTPNEPPSP
ncbi:hypothetical protein POSPLADRAFT_1056584 [Postia placenta MAD-698-R-SB12]|uniref:Fungal STAND N-terminal Goodbye domain-containing protein n=1 Tax=Postia placenta MAD-698-R-SB12 TaxID=670580 RepID=A0A1X6N064_9APHY|nr:hypothetical protein POSPLADRAFT_1056584 [Postia placenta MAD-698-R-SB12]OSX61995.1 hypothetical protein POSPLADRAFT_1056584 [Postia placenta MAD-698-R-SB12]